ncbi:MAG: sodium:alanine symporter family protein [Firmicutes bacterium]|nr:sodium:alanine symporter family protein [Bacillota bacterium]
MEAILKTIEDFVWGPPLIFLILGAGTLYTFRLGALQFRKFPFIMKNTFLRMFDKVGTEEGAVSPFQALSTALAATVGTGNIVGVSTAILTGGPGAVFWMWLAAFLGMATKYAEVTLALAYREKNAKGEYVGGPMYYLQKGLGFTRLAGLFALFAAFAAFGIGNMTQANAIAGVLEGNFGLPRIAMGILLPVLVSFVILGGIRSISRVTEKLVPFMSLFYILGGLVLLVIHAENIPGALASIFSSAFSSRAALGGAAGFGFMQAIRSGISRGVFTNEAGLGSSPIAQATAQVDHPCRQGIWGVFEVFVDTILVCTITALVILTAGLTDFGTDASTLASRAFSTGFPLGSSIVTIGLVLFAFSTILGWEYYGETAAAYVFGDRVRRPYKALYVILVGLGAVISLDLVWALANILNALMAFPNLIGLLGLSGVVVRLSQDFFKDPDRVREDPREYLDLVTLREKK